ncbi:MAG: ATP-binding protein [Nitrospinota bacterium]|jgi:PAS domain S-box-containing protein|nr:ATP-binding protein [Nitrospinota bacterium]MDP7664423.1 ATP-binding protein [Nitrospinota bacterium]
MYWSDETYRIFGVEPQEIAITFEKFISRVHPEDRDTVRERNINLSQEEGTFRLDYRIPLLDGNSRIVHAESKLFRDKTGNPIRIVGTVQDVIEKIRAERKRERYIKRLATLNDLTLKISTSLDLDEVLESILESARSLLDLSDVAVFICQEDIYSMRASLGDYFSEEPQGTYGRGDGEVGMAAKTSQLQFIENVKEFPFWKKPDVIRKYGIESSLSVPLKYEEQTIGVLSCLTRKKREYTKGEFEIIKSLANMAAIAIENAENYSNLRKALEELRLSQEMIVRAEKPSSLGTLAAGAAHEILNPAGVIQLRAEMLASDVPGGSEEKQSADIIVRNVNRIKKICDDLRRFSRDEVPSTEPFDPDDALDASLNLIKYEFSPSGVKMKLNLSEGPSVVMEDANQIQQVFLNLISNVLDAMPGGGTLSISSGRVEVEGNQFWEVRVSDTGEGISSEALPRIFDPFFTTKEPDKGTGLGLSVLHGTVKNHGGEVLLETETGEGTTFIVRFPALQTTQIQKENRSPGFASPPALPHVILLPPAK